MATNIFLVPAPRAGTVLRLDVTRDADHKTFDVTLRDLIPPAGSE
jgi:hypothetical protein